MIQATERSALPLQVAQKLSVGPDVRSSPNAIRLSRQKGAEVPALFLSLAVSASRLSSVSARPQRYRSLVAAAGTPALLFALLHFSFALWHSCPRGSVSLAGDSLLLPPPTPAARICILHSVSSFGLPISLRTHAAFARARLARWPVLVVVANVVVVWGAIQQQRGSRSFYTHSHFQLHPLPRRVLLSCYAEQLRSKELALFICHADVLRVEISQIYSISIRT